MHSSQSCVSIRSQGTLLDPLARLALWQVGLDYSHGTGHGIGSFLNVHEGPQTIHSRPQPANEPGLEQGMFVSDGTEWTGLY